ncbi:unnamed protein product [Caenorhabditis auriculariae]|uniref:RWD domain-containing protein n=1 Tax=Caenorhabditis auriculariae TaxID=2777116 RepID=A0A8S1HPQ3_9PELO|nr:unnamed protein product [Caenorhabditis auriculariae]
MDDSENREQEIELLSAVYPDILKNRKSETAHFLFFDQSIRLTVDLPNDYPSSAPPRYELSGPSLTRNERIHLENSLNEEFLKNLGMPVLYNWVNMLLEFVTEREGGSNENQDDSMDSRDSQDSLDEEEIPQLDIKHGEVFTDRKSNFQAHLSVVKSKKDVENMLRTLKSNTKIMRATHNIYAYRYTEIKDGRNFPVHDCEDDGETGASSKMLDLMDRMSADNVIVVVTRWYGGIHLGPDRFRHINNLTREILVANGYGKK